MVLLHLFWDAGVAALTHFVELFGHRGLLFVHQLLLGEHSSVVLGLGFGLCLGCGTLSSRLKTILVLRTRTFLVTG